MNFSVTDLGGSLPSSWSSSSAFPQLITLSFNATQLFGTLPDAWGQPGSSSKLTNLYLNHSDITGATQLSVLHCLSIAFMCCVLACLPTSTSHDTYTLYVNNSSKNDKIALGVHFTETPAMLVWTCYFSTSFQYLCLCFNSHLCAYAGP